MSLLVTGSIGIDSVSTPHGEASEVLGGSAVYFGVAAGLFTDVRLVAVVGEDFPPAFRDQLTRDRIDLAGLETRAGSKTFRWSGKYSPDMNDRETLGVELNVLAEPGAKVPAAFQGSDVVFLANTHPVQQRETLGQVAKPKLSVLDTMDLWIDNERDELGKTIAAVDGVIINDAESLHLTGKSNVIDAGRAILGMGPRFVVVKKGEHGAVLVTGDSVTAIPAFPTTEVKDPTGAGDSFAGGMLGYLDQVGSFETDDLRRALVRGTVAASITIESFSLQRIAQVTADEVNARVKQFTAMLHID